MAGRGVKGRSRSIVSNGPGRVHNEVFHRVSWGHHGDAPGRTQLLSSCRRTIQRSDTFGAHPPGRRRSPTRLTSCLRSLNKYSSLQILVLRNGTRPVPGDDTHPYPLRPSTGSSVGPGPSSTFRPHRWLGLGFSGL